MSDADDVDVDVDDTIVVRRADDDRTVVVSRPGRRRADPEHGILVPPTSRSGDEPVDDKTIVRPRLVHETAATSAAVDETIVRPHLTGEAAADGIVDGVVEDVVDDTTLSSVVDDETIVRSSAGDETVVRPGRARRRAATAPASARAAHSQRAVAGRVALPSRFAPSPNAARGVGVDAVHAYRPRPIPPVPEAPAVSTEGEPATRLDAPSTPSVHRASRRFGFAALAWLAAACLVSVVGLVVLYGVVFG